MTPCNPLLLRPRTGQAGTQGMLTKAIASFLPSGIHYPFDSTRFPSASAVVLPSILLSVSFPNRIVKQDRKQADSFYDLFCTVKKDPARKSLQGLLAIGFASGFAVGVALKHKNYFARFSLIAACAAARRAIGTRNGEQET